MPRILGFLFLIMFFTSSAYSMTIDEAVSHAMKNNPELQALRLEEETAKGQLEKARLLLINNPAIEGSLSKKEKPIEEGSGKYKNYGIKLSQEFEIAGQRGLRIEVAEKGLSKVRLEIENRERILTNEVKDAFAKTLASKKKVELTKEVVRLKEDLLNFTKIKFQAGDVSGLEVNLAEVELSKTKRDLILSEREYKEALLSLQGLLGVKPDNAFRIKGELSAEMPSLPDKEKLQNLALIRPDAKAAVMEEEKSNAALFLIKREAVPNITLSGFYDRDENRNVAGLSVSIPLPIFDRKKAERKEAKTNAEQAKINRSGIEKAIEREFDQAYNAFVSSHEEISVFKKEILSKSLENLSLLNLAFKEGKIGFFDVRLAQRDAIDIQFSYLDAVLRAQQAIYAMERTIGGKLK
mgnify:FL=1